jgi:hypothetical protein
MTSGAARPPYIASSAGNWYHSHDSRGDRGCAPPVLADCVAPGICVENNGALMTARGDTAPIWCGAACPMHDVESQASNTNIVISTYCSMICCARDLKSTRVKRRSSHDILDGGSLLPPSSSVSSSIGFCISNDVAPSSSFSSSEPST